MSLPINISDLINRRVVESARVEYKGDWNPEPILHSICAFANDIDNWGGGYIIIGVDEEDGMPKFPIKGLEKKSIDRINKELPHFRLIVHGLIIFAHAGEQVVQPPGTVIFPEPFRMRLQYRRGFGGSQCNGVVAGHNAVGDHIADTPEVAAQIFQRDSAALP